MSGKKRPLRRYLGLRGLQAEKLVEGCRRGHAAGILDGEGNGCAYYGRSKIFDEYFIRLIAGGKWAGPWTWKKSV
jgi:hypothetical protein